MLINLRTAQDKNRRKEYQGYSITDARNVGHTQATRYSINNFNIRTDLVSSII